MKWWRGSASHHHPVPVCVPLWVWWEICCCDTSLTLSLLIFVNNTIILAPGYCYDMYATCVCVYMYVCVCLGAGLCGCTCVYVCVHVHMCVCVSCMHTCRCVCRCAATLSRFVTHLCDISICHFRSPAVSHINSINLPALFYSAWGDSDYHAVVAADIFSFPHIFIKAA